MNELLFKIRNLQCSYGPHNRIVLDIKELDIPRKKIIVFLGVSGIGKSTLLETIGLMNNTIRRNPDTALEFFPEENNMIKLHEIWDKKDKIRSAIRNKYFSFIFQETNLMPNFSIFENICLTLLLQGVSLNEAMKISDKDLSELNLDNVNINQKIYELSGGEKQRVSFVRAIAPNFKVIFGDEPTGNLDITTAHVLMSMLKKHVIGKGCSAVIVSHAIDLSLEFADQIVVIDKKIQDSENGVGKPFGFIDESCVFIRNSETGVWSQNDQIIEKSKLYEYVKAKNASINQSSTMKESLIKIN